MRPQPEILVADFMKSNLVVAGKLQNSLSEMMALEKDWSMRINKTLIHGDYHLENIIVSDIEPGHIKVIDFTDLAWGDPCLDLGGFLQQFDFMLQNTLSRQQINDYKIYFIEAYFEASFSDIDPVFISRINLYQAWTTLRTIALLFYTKDSRHELENLLVEMENHLVLARRHLVQINLN
jgi:aminoglycoside phosphotransferase (APT) family kinase protein